MASKNTVCFLLLLLSATLFVTVRAARPDDDQTDQPKSSHVNVGLISHLLSHKGYHAMALTLDTIHLEALIPTQLITHNSTTFTLFCPKDQAFLASKYPQPPLTLLKYHIVPFKVDKDTFKSTTTSDFAGHGSKMDTLLPGHPLVVTSLAGGPYTSLNQVKVAEWELYNDGQLIIHGVDDFFDPAFQILRYPQYDPKINVKEEVASSNRLMEATENWFLLSLIAAASINVLIIVLCAKHKQQQEDDVEISYAPLYQLVLGSFTM